MALPASLIVFDPADVANDRNSGLVAGKQGPRIGSGQIRMARRASRVLPLIQQLSYHHAIGSVGYPAFFVDDPNASNVWRLLHVPERVAEEQFRSSQHRLPKGRFDGLPELLCFQLCPALEQIVKELSQSRHGQKL